MIAYLRDCLAWHGVSVADAASVIDAAQQYGLEEVASWNWHDHAIRLAISDCAQLFLFAELP